MRKTLLKNCEVIAEFCEVITIFCLRVLVPGVCPLPAFFPRKLTLLPAYFTRKHILLIHEAGYSVQDRDFLERMKSLVLNNRTRKNIEILFEEYGFDYSIGRSEIIHTTGLSRSSATELLTRLKLNGLIIPAEECNKYHFIV